MPRPSVRGAMLHSVRGAMLHSVRGAMLHSVRGAMLHSVRGAMLHSVCGSSTMPRPSMCPYQNGTHKGARRLPLPWLCAMSR